MPIVISGDTAVKERIRGVAERSKETTVALRRVGTYMRRTYSKQFTTEGKYLGTPWKPLNPKYAAQKRIDGYAGRILVRDGDLRESYVLKSKAYESIKGNVGEYGSRDRKAAWHQYGTRSHKTGKSLIPARKVVVVNAMVRKDVKDVIRKYILGIDDTQYKAPG